MTPGSETSVTVGAPDAEGARKEGARLLGVAPEQVTVEPSGEGAYTVTPRSAPGQFEIKVREDKMAALIEMITPAMGDGEAVTAGDIEKALSEQKVTFGIDAGAIRQVVAQVAATGEARKGVTVAVGKPPVPGCDAQFEWHMGEAAANKHPQARGFVRPGQVLAVKTPATHGKEGRSVLGEEVPCEAGQDKELIAGEDVTVSADGAAFISALYGTVEVTGGTISVNSCVRTSDDALSAWITLCPRLSDNSALALADVLAALDQAGVAHGVKKDAIAAVLAQSDTVQEIVVAEGTPAQDGMDASIAFKFQAGSSAGALNEETDRMDYRERGTLHNVRAGDLLAVKTPATLGEDGVGVFGGAIRATPGKDATLTAGENVTVSGDGLKCTAGIDGVVSLVGEGTISVFECYEVPGDVDYSIGNLAMDGTLVVQGWIRSGFAVRARGDLCVGAGIEDATVVVGGNIDVRGGIVGNKTGRICAAGDIRARFVESAYLQAEGDVIVGDSIMHSMVLAGGRVQATEGKGRVIGGTTTAGKDINVNELGSGAAARTVVNAGADARALEQIASLEKELRLYGRNKRKIALALASLGRKAAQRSSAAREAGALAKLVKVRREAALKEAKLARYRMSLVLAAQDQVEPVEISVRRAVHEGTIVTLMGHRFPVKEDINEGGRFTLDTKEWAVNYMVQSK